MDCVCEKMWLSAVLLLTMILTLLEIFLLGHYGHQVLEEQLSTVQTSNRMPQNR